MPLAIRSASPGRRRPHRGYSGSAPRWASPPRESPATSARRRQPSAERHPHPRTGRGLPGDRGHARARVRHRPRRHRQVDAAQPPHLAHAEADRDLRADRGRRAQRGRADHPLAVPPADRGHRRPRHRPERRGAQDPQRHGHARDRRGVDGERRPAWTRWTARCARRGSGRTSRSAACRSCSSATRTSSPRCRATATSARYFADTYRRCGSSTRTCGDEADLRIYELGEIHRQHDDEFKHMLNAVRHGAVTAEIARRAERRRARAGRCPSRARSRSPPRTRRSTASTARSCTGCPGSRSRTRPR